MSELNILYDRVDALLRALERERKARHDAECAAARAGAEAGALRLEVRRLCERVEELEAAAEAGPIDANSCTGCEGDCKYCSRTEVA